VDTPREDPPERRPVVDKPLPPPRDPPDNPGPPPENKCPNPAFKQASGGGAIGVSYNPPDGSGSGTAAASLDINSSGRVSNFSFTDRSGNALFDQAFESAAKARTYDAALRECFAVDGGKVNVSASFTSPEIKKVEPPPPSCREAASPARITRGFNIERAYPQRAIDRGQEGTVSATLQISATGDVVGVVINSENPPGVFGTAVQREAARMKFAPARANCENVADTIRLPVQFTLGE
jgi:TonB family protein